MFESVHFPSVPTQFGFMYSGVRIAYGISDLSTLIFLGCWPTTERSYSTATALHQGFPVQENTVFDSTLDKPTDRPDAGGPT